MASMSLSLSLSLCVCPVSSAAVGHLIHQLATDITPNDFGGLIAHLI